MVFQMDVLSQSLGALEHASSVAIIALKESTAGRAEFDGYAVHPKVVESPQTTKINERKRAENERIMNLKLEISNGITHIAKPLGLRELIIHFKLHREGQLHVALFFHLANIAPITHRLVSIERDVDFDFEFHGRGHKTAQIADIELREARLVESRRGRRDIEPKDLRSVVLIDDRNAHVADDAEIKRIAICHATLLQHHSRRIEPCLDEIHRLERTEIAIELESMMNFDFLIGFDGLRHVDCDDSTNRIVMRFARTRQMKHRSRTQKT